MALRVGHGGQPLERGAVGHVVVPLPALVLHHVALVLQALLVQRGEQRAHPVGLEPQGQLEFVGRHRLEVVGALEAGGAVERTAGALHEFEVPVARHLRGPLEHQVLEEVCQAGAALHLVPGADVVPQAHGGDRRLVVLGEHHAQAVGEFVLGGCQPAGRRGRGRVSHGVESLRSGWVGVQPSLYAGARTAGSPSKDRVSRTVRTTVGPGARLSAARSTMVRVSPLSRAPAGGTRYVRRSPCRDGPPQYEDPATGRLRGAHPRHRRRRRDAGLLPGVRLLGDLLACPAGRAGRHEAGAPPHPLPDARDGPASRAVLRQVRPRRGRGDGQASPAR